MIAMNDFRREGEELLKAQLAAAERVFRSGWYVLGKEVQSFEAEWATWVGTAHAVGVGNGMDALEIGLRALGIGPGDEVVTTPMTAFATVLAVLRAGAIPVLADIDPDSGILDPDSVERCLSSRTKAVIVVHLYGRCAPLDRFEQMLGPRGIALIEDCAQAHGARWRGKGVGTVGAFAGWSFYPTKNLGAIGDAGALTTDDAALAAAAATLRNYGQSVRYHHPHVGLNSRLDELQAAILRERLPLLDGWIEARRRIAAALRVGIVNPLVRCLPAPEDPLEHAYHLFVVTCEQRDALAAHLKACGVDALAHYPIPVHFQEPCLELPRDPQGLARAELHARICLSLPCHPHLTSEEVETIVAAVNAFGA